MGQVVLLVVAPLVAVGMMVMFLKFGLRLGEATNGRAPLIVWMLAIVLGVSLNIYDAFEQGWKTADTLGVTFASLLLVGLVNMYRTQKRGPK